MSKSSISIESWEEVREKIKEADIELTDEDLEYVPGQEKELFEKLAQKLHKTPEDVRVWIESVSANKSIAG